MYEIGKPLELEKKEVSGDYEVEKGQYYGCEMKLRIGFLEYSQMGFDEGLAKKLWNNIEKYGEKPIYVKVDSSWNWLYFAYDVNVEMHIQHTGSSPGISSIILAITAFLIAITLFLYVSYYIFVEKKPPPFPELSKEAIAILILLLVIILILGRRK